MSKTFRIGDKVVRNRNSMDGMCKPNVPVVFIGVVSYAGLDGLKFECGSAPGRCMTSDFDLYVEAPKSPTLEQLRVNLRDSERAMEVATEAHRAAKTAWGDAIEAIDYPACGTSGCCAQPSACPMKGDTDAG